jgi:AsmA protein
MVRNVATAFADSTAAQTAFSQLGGSFTIANGILINKDLALQSPALRADGAGTIDLPRRSIDYRLTPRLGAAAGLAGLAVSVVIRGPLEHPSYQPDLAGVLKDQAADPTKLMETLQPGTKPTNLLKGLLGGSAKSPP